MKTYITHKATRPLTDRSEICRIAGTKVPFVPRLFVLGDGAILNGIDEHIRSWVQTSLMTARPILLRQWRNEGVPSIQAWACEMARVAVFEKMSYKQFSRLDVYRGKWGKYLSFLEGS